MSVHDAASGLPTPPSTLFVGGAEVVIVVVGGYSVTPGKTTPPLRAIRGVVNKRRAVLSQRGGFGDSSV
jgi:hypothetical protein